MPEHRTRNLQDGVALQHSPYARIPVTNDIQVHEPDYLETLRTRRSGRGDGCDWSRGSCWHPWGRRPRWTVRYSVNHHSVLTYICMMICICMDIQGVYIHAYAHIRTRRDTQKHTANMNTCTQSLWMMEDATRIRAPAQKRDKHREILPFALCPCLSTRLSLPRHFCMEHISKYSSKHFFFTSHSDTLCPKASIYTKLHQQLIHLPF
jgi:hypothetical protein